MILAHNVSTIILWDLKWFARFAHLLPNLSTMAGHMDEESWGWLKEAGELQAKAGKLPAPWILVFNFQVTKTFLHFWVNISLLQKCHPLNLKSKTNRKRTTGTYISASLSSFVSCFCHQLKYIEILMSWIVTTKLVMQDRERDSLIASTYPWETAEV